MKKNYRGAITIYLSIIFMIFIVLTTVLIEAARVRIAKPKVFRAVNSSAQSLLSEYHTPLKKYYGLFGIRNNDKELSQEGKRFVDRTLNMQNYLPGSNPIFNMLNGCCEKDFINMYDFKTSHFDLTFENKNNMINSSVVNKQILDYMKYREPYLITRKLLTQLDVIKQADNTIDLIEQKQKLDKKMEQYEKKYQKLIRYVDGLDVNNKRIVNGFVKQLVTEEIDSTACLSNIPDINIIEQIKSKRLEIKKFHKWVKQLDSFIIQINQIRSMDDKMKYLKTKKDDDSQNKYKSLLKSKEVLEKLIIFKYGNTKDKDYYDVIDTVDDKAYFYYSQLNKIYDANQKTIKCIKELRSLSVDLKKEINQFMNILKTKKDEIDISTYNNFMDDIENASSKLYKNSLSKAEKLVSNNILCLQDLLNKSRNIKTIKRYIDENDYDFFDENIKPIIDCILIVNKNYKIDIIFNYKLGQDIKTEGSINKVKNIVQKGVELSKHIENKSIINKNSELYKNLPSTIKDYKYNPLENIFKLNTNGFKDIKNIANTLNIIADKLKNQLCLNSYITNKFYNLCTNKNGHYFDNEIEYILHGNFNERKNVNSAKHKIILMRTALNTIYLYKDTEKREITFSLASAISGWWTLGIGSYVTQAIIIELWSLAEAYVDYYSLIHDKKIPLIKDKEDWFLDIDNLLNFSFEKLESYMSHNQKIKNENTKDKKIDDLCYRDYLYILLLTCSNETKITRIQDLIQLNIIKNWDQNFKFNNYSVGFKINTNVDYNYLFLKSFKVPHIEYSSEYCY